MVNYYHHVPASIRANTPPNPTRAPPENQSFTDRRFLPLHPSTTISRGIAIQEAKMIRISQLGTG
ncbi:hypothetical protein N7491_010887 [Penicillium cf. griseofulvum]|uniref:Uncharacterized protein n=1 Tax=Penicillium cf. griseofulvum TaxID=2972120 RepID=A0A9W9T771_9EURO|nr:hypothetical protein N7472_001209 [Penicillium cf. griseofulvum]KAJ5422442.1 hypothetical protein N7491_010887 [Penicillium cf. griseofulvum]